MARSKLNISDLRGDTRRTEGKQSIPRVLASWSVQQRHFQAKYEMAIKLLPIAARRQGLGHPSRAGCAMQLLKYPPSGGQSQLETKLEPFSWS